MIALDGVVKRYTGWTRQFENFASVESFSRGLCGGSLLDHQLASSREQWNVPPFPVQYCRFSVVFDPLHHCGIPFPPMGISTQSVGQTLSHYRILRKIGGGAAWEWSTKPKTSSSVTNVALKFLPDELAHDAQALSRFQREARAASSLNLPNICTIHEIDESDGRTFIAMELLEGQMLRHLIAGKPLRTVKSISNPEPILLDSAPPNRAFHGPGPMITDVWNV